MKARIIDRNDVLKIADLLRGQGYDVIAPFRGRGRDTFFESIVSLARGSVRIAKAITNPAADAQNKEPHAVRMRLFE